MFFHQNRCSLLDKIVFLHTTMGMKYLTLFSPNHFVAYVLNVKTAQKDDINHAYSLVERMRCTGVLSNYRDILRAHFKRRADTGEILLSDLPKRLDVDGLLAFLDDLSFRKQKRKAHTHPNSLANLSQSYWFTKDNRPIKPRKIFQDHLDRARELRAQGCSWRLVGDRLGLNASSIRTAFRLEAAKSAKNKAEKGELRG